MLQATRQIQDKKKVEIATSTLLLYYIKGGERDTIEPQRL